MNNVKEIIACLCLNSFDIILVEDKLIEISNLF